MLHIHLHSRPMSILVIIHLRILSIAICVANDLPCSDDERSWRCSFMSDGNQWSSDQKNVEDDIELFAHALYQEFLKRARVRVRRATGSGLLSVGTEEPLERIFRDTLLVKLEREKYEKTIGQIISEKLEKNTTTTETLHLHTEQRMEDPIEALLADLKNILIKHLSGDYNENLCYAVIFALCTLEKDIKQHNRIRYRILKPMVDAMEKLCI